MQMTAEPNAHLDKLRVAWNRLHQYPVDFCDEWSADQARDWLVDWQASPLHADALSSIDWIGICQEQPPQLESAAEFFEWTVVTRTAFHRSAGLAPVSGENIKRSFRFPSKRGQVQPLITWENFTADTLLLTQEIVDRYPNLDGIAGCPRSGMRAAAEIAIRLDVRLYEASLEHGLRRCSSGLRLSNHDLHGEPRPFGGPIVIVEDSTCSGTSVRTLKQNPELAALPCFAVYAGNDGRELVDGFAVNIDLPHWFEWNFFGNGQLLREWRVGLDWDGVLNADCPSHCDDDGFKYAQWMESVKPIRGPRRYEVPFIVTARCERYRTASVEWLRRYGFRYGELVMFPGSFQERSQTDLGGWKAEMCKKYGVGLFVESCPVQAHRIAELRCKTVLCTGMATGDQSEIEEKGRGNA